MKNLILLLPCFCSILLAGCLRESSYESFADPEKKGKTYFSKQWESCRTNIDLLMKPSEGSEGAGELHKRKQRMLLLCMEKNGWRLKI